MAAAPFAPFSNWSARDIAEAKAAGDPAGVAAALEPALADLQAATMWLAQNGMADPDNAGAGAYAYMDLMGLVSLGWMWLKLAAAAKRASTAAPATGRSMKRSWSRPILCAARTADVGGVAEEDRGRRGDLDEDPGGSLLKAGQRSVDQLPVSATGADVAHNSSILRSASLSG